MLATLFEHVWPLAKCLKVFLNILAINIVKQFKNNFDLFG